MLRVCLMQEILEWYCTIRAARIKLLASKFPQLRREELLYRVSRDFVKYGWLLKTPPTHKASKKVQSVHVSLWWTPHMDSGHPYPPVPLLSPASCSFNLHLPLQNPFQRRWFALDEKRLMYWEKPLVSWLWRVLAQLN